MRVMIMDYSDSIDMLLPIGREWAASAHGAEYGLPIDINTARDTLHMLAMRSDGDVLVLVDDCGEPCGFMGLSYQLNHVGPGMVANECMFYVARSARSGGVKLIRAARQLAKAKGCGWLFLNASRIAGDGDRSGALYERMGFRQFDASYLGVL